MFDCEPESNYFAVSTDNRQSQRFTVHDLEADSFVHLDASDHSVMEIQGPEIDKQTENDRYLISPGVGSQMLSPVPIGVKMVKLLPKESLQDDSSIDRILHSEQKKSNRQLNLLRDPLAIQAVLLPHEVKGAANLLHEFLRKTPTSGSKKKLDHFQDNDQLQVSPIALQFNTPPKEACQ